MVLGRRSVWWPNCSQIPTMCLYIIKAQGISENYEMFEDTRAVSPVVDGQVACRFGFSAEWSDLAFVRNTSRGSELKHARTLICVYQLSGM